MSDDSATVGDDYADDLEDYDADAAEAPAKAERPEKQAAEDDDTEDEEEEGIDEEEGDPAGGEAPAAAPGRAPRPEADPAARATRIDRRVVVEEAERITSDMMTRLEVARLVGIRGAQIAGGSQVYIETRGLSDPCEIARRELLERRTPLQLVRVVGQKEGVQYIEKWDPNTEMSIPTSV